MTLGLDRLVGLSREKEKARIEIRACRATGRPFGHLMIDGPGGCGKTELALAIAEELGYHFVMVEGAALKTRDQIVARLLSAQEEAQRVGKTLLLFIDEAHRLTQPQQEAFYYPLDKKRPRITTAAGTIYLAPFTLIAATTRKDILDQASFVNRFANIWRISRFQLWEISAILAAHFSDTKMKYNICVLKEIGQRSLGIPRQALRLADKVINRALSQGRHHLTVEDCQVVFRLEGVDAHGLGELHIAYLKVLAEAHNQPRGLDGIAAAISEHVEVVASTVEPILLNLRLIDRSPRGRIITQKGISYLQTGKFA